VNWFTPDVRSVAATGALFATGLDDRCQDAVNARQASGDAKCSNALNSPSTGATDSTSQMMRALHGAVARFTQNGSSYEDNGSRSVSGWNLAHGTRLAFYENGPGVSGAIPWRPR
jgi:hypothetical protein